MTNVDAPNARPVWVYLCGVCAALVIPILAVASVLLWQFARSEEARLRLDVSNTNTQILAALERQLSAEIAILRTLATSPSLFRDDYNAFSTQVNEVVRGDLKASDIILVNEDGLKIFDGGIHGALGVPDVQKLRAQAPIVSNLVRGNSFSTSYFTISVPVIGDSHAARLAARIPLSTLTGLIAEQSLDPGYFSSIVDRHNAVLARSEGSEQYYGKVLPGAAAAEGKEKFEWSGINPQGVEVYGVISHDSLANWAVTTGISTSVLHSAFHRTLRWLVALALAALVTGGIVAFTAAFVLARSARRIAESAAQIIDDRDVTPLLTPVKEANLIGAALKTASERIRSQAEALRAANGSLERQVEERTRELKAKSKLLETTLENMDQGLIVLDAEGRIRLHNRRAVEMTGLPEELLVSGATVADTVKFQVGRGDFAQLPEDLAIAMNPGLVAPGQTLVHDRVTGEGRTIEVRTVPIDGGAGLVRTYTDVTLRRLAEMQLRHAARHDVLTGLPNRLEFDEHLQQAIARFRRDGLPFSVLLVDVDHFKAINDAYGHPAGDQVLREVSARFRSVLRMEDTVARIGGDEFAILQVNGVDRNDARALAQRLHSVVAGKYTLDAADAFIGISIGFAGSSSTDGSIERIMEYADQALYEAKRAGRNCYREFRSKALEYPPRVAV